jgi:RNA polymerase sigma factor (sigma-70 family)
MSSAAFAAKPHPAPARIRSVITPPDVPPDTGPDDAALVALIVTGDQGAVAELYHRHGAACFRLARQVTSSTSLAEDAVQEAFLGLWRDPDRYRPALGSVRTWLLGLAHHKAVDAVRRQSSWQRRQDLGAAQAVLMPEAADDTATTALADLNAAEIRSAVADLPAPQRQAVALAYFGGYTQTEIAGLTGVPLGTVKTRTVAAMRRLRLRLGPLAATAQEVSR